MCSLARLSTCHNTEECLKCTVFRLTFIKESELVKVIQYGIWSFRIKNYQEMKYYLGCHSFDCPALWHPFYVLLCKIHPKFWKMRPISPKWDKRLLSYIKYQVQTFETLKRITYFLIHPKYKLIYNFLI